MMESLSNVVFWGASTSDLVASPSHENQLIIKLHNIFEFLQEHT